MIPSCVNTENPVNSSLSPAERRTLKARAHHLNPVVIVGDAGLTEAVLREIDVHLKSHELIKIRVAGDDRDARASMMETVCASINASPVQQIGKLLVVYRPKPPEELVPAGEKKRRRATVKSKTGKKRPRKTKRSFQG